MLTQALGRLFAVAEAYPDLKANQNFLALQHELTATEDRIAAGRRYYNANVRELNTKVESVPSNIVAGMFHISRAEYFEAEDAQREAPQVSFGGPGRRAGPDRGRDAARADDLSRPPGHHPSLLAAGPAPGTLTSADPASGRCRSVHGVGLHLVPNPARCRTQRGAEPSARGRRQTVRPRRRGCTMRYGEIPGHHGRGAGPAAGPDGPRAQRARRRTSRPAAP